MTRTHITVVLAAVALATAAWIDPLYIPMILLGPLLSGIVAGAREAHWRPLAATWGLAGVLVLVSDLAINGEDAAFHAVVTLLTAGLARVGVAAGRLIGRCRDSESLAVPYGRS